MQDFVRNTIEYHLTYRKPDEAFAKTDIYYNVLIALNEAKRLIEEEKVSFYSLNEVHTNTKGFLNDGNV
jgi:hypothetical protein